MGAFKSNGPAGSIYSTKILKELESTKQGSDSRSTTPTKSSDHGKYKDYDTLKKPNDHHFCPVRDAPMTKGQPIPFYFLVKAL